MAGRTVKQLRDLEIDEVSLVDRPANQHGLVAITKRDEGTMDELFDERGNPISEDQLQPGDVAYTADGERLVMLTDDDVQDLLDQGYDVEDVNAEVDATADHFEDAGFEVDDRELAGVGKAVTGTGSLNREALRAIGRNVRGYAGGTTTRRRAAGAAAITGGTTSAVSYIGGRGRRETKAARFTGPSLGREVVAELSKAVSDSDRDSVISKVAQHVDRLSEIAETAVAKADALEAYVEEQGWLEVAKGYDVPAREDELARILQGASSVLSKRDMDTLDRVLKAAGEPVYYDEAGVPGYSADSEVMDQVMGLVQEIVGKADVTPEQATTAVFQADPNAYDRYLAERAGFQG